MPRSKSRYRTPEQEPPASEAPSPANEAPEPVTEAPKPEAPKPEAPAPVKESKPAEDEGHDTATYHPGFGDPHQITWRGHTFVAGKPTKVTDAGHLSAFEANKFFKVKRKGGEREQKDDKDKSTDDHRRDFSDAVAKETTVEGVIRCFANERKRREENDIGTDDMQPLMAQLEPRLREMRFREGMGDRQMAEIYLKYGMSGS